MSLDSAKRTLVVVAGAVGVLFYLWTLNYNKLGDFSDYSIIVDAAGKFGAGLRPVRDFSSVIQSLTIWLAYGCERVFGARYLSLAYGNLILTLCIFFVVFRFARRAFSLPLAISIAMAVCVASSLQHGIIWYNSIGLLLLAAISLKCADLLRAHAIRARDVFVLASLLLLIGLTKMNFNAIAIGTIVSFALADAMSAPRIRNWKKISALAGLALLVSAAPPFIEAFVDHVTLSAWVREVILTPVSARMVFVKSVLDPNFYFFEMDDWFPGTVMKGSVLLCLIVYGFLLYVAVLQFFEDKRRDFKGLIVRLGMICLFWGSACLLVSTNQDIQSLSLCFCVIGVAGMQMSGQFSGRTWEKTLRGSAIVLVVYFFLVGSVSLVRHSRISFLANDFPGTTIEKNDGPAFLRGVTLSRQSTVKMGLIEEVLKKNSGVPVYWGPGLQMMNQIRGGVTDPAFPLWYQLGATYRQSDTPAIINGIERSGAGLFVAGRFWYDFYYVFPPEIQNYLDRNWILVERDDSLVVFKKRIDGHSGVAVASR